MMKKSVLMVFIIVVCVMFSVMAVDDNVIMDGLVIFNGKVIVLVCILVAVMKDFVVILLDVSVMKL